MQWAVQKGVFVAGGNEATIEHLPAEKLRRYRFVFPPAGEQLAIAAFLDRETAKIDALVAEQQRLIELLKEKRQAVISHAVTKGLDPNAKMKPSGIEWLGAVPAHWELHRIGRLFQEASDPGSDDLPVLSVSIHDGVSDDELGDDDLERKVTRSEDRTKYKRVRPRDLVYNMMRAWQGGFGTVVVDGMVSPAYVVARPRDGVPTWLVEQQLRTPTAVQEMRRHSRGVTDFRLRLYWEEFKTMVVTLPPDREVAAIERFLRREEGASASLVAEAERAIILLQERRTALISAAVTGQIDVRSIELRGSLEGTPGSKNDDASLTISEAAFEAFCTAAAIPFVRIPRKQNERTADYLVNSGAQQFVVELKQFDPNEEEQAAIAARAEGKVVAQGGEPGSRIRLAIQNAAPQLRLSSAGRLPAMLVVYNCTGVNMHTDPYSVATAMHGLDVIDIAVPVETSESPKFGPPRSGPKKKMTANSHTSISAIAVLGYNLDGSMRLDVFHNRHAKNLLDPDMLRGQRVHHWRLPDGARSSLVEWDPV